MLEKPTNKTQVKVKFISVDPYLYKPDHLEYRLYLDIIKDIPNFDKIDRHMFLAYNNKLRLVPHLFSK